MKIPCFSVLLLLCGWSSTFAAPVVVLSGDSITNSYQDEFAALAAGSSMVSSFVGAGSLTSEAYRLNGYPVAVTNANPDTIVLMLGINDALKNRGAVDEGIYDTFRENMNLVFDQFDSDDASRVLVLSLLPINEQRFVDTYPTTPPAPQDGPGTNLRVNGTGANTSDPTLLSFGYNPWLEREVGERNDGTGPVYEYLDVNSSIQLNPNWEAEWLQADGLHLNDLGQQWLAGEVYTVAAVPEPSAFLAVGVIGLASIGIQRLRRRRGI